MLGFRTKSGSVAGLLESQVYTDKRFYKQFMQDLKVARGSILIESPYMTTARTWPMLKTLASAVNRGVKIEIHTRYPGHHEPALEAQSWEVTRILKQMGIRVFFYHDLLHRKIAIIDDNILWEGSLNILSQANSAEYMRRINSTEITAETMKIIKKPVTFWK